MATDFFKIGQATGQQFTDVSGAVQRGLEAGLKPFAEYEKSRKERVEALGRILQTTPNLDELPKIPAQYSPKISEWASNAKNEYADAAKALVQMSPETAEYREAVQKMNNIKTAFANLDNQLNGIREERIEYLDDYQNGMVSKGFKNSDIEAAYGANGAIAEIDANGNVSMTGNEGKAFIWSERQEHYNVNPYMQKSMVGLSDNAKENGLKGISFTQDEYKERLKAIMSNPETGNIRALKSLVYDDLDGINTLNIAQTNPEILALLEAETPDLPAIKQKLVDILAPALADVNQTSIGQYNKALPPEFNKPTEGDKKYARNTDNIIAAAQQMYLNGKLPDTLPGLTEIPINSREYVINSQIDAQNKAIAKGDLLKNDALTKEELESQYTAPYYTLDLRPIKSIRQAINIAYGADDNQIKSALSALSSLEEYDASKLLFSTQPNLDTPEDTSEDPIKLPPPPDKKTEITQTIQLRGKYAYAKNYLDDMKKLIEEANTYKKIRSRRGRDYKPKDKEERNQKIEQIKAFEAALKREFPNLDLSNIQIPK